MGVRAMTLELGVMAKDEITGFSGKITGVCRYVAGADQYLLAPKVDVEGKYVKAVWFDADRVVEIEDKG
jgi:hypothetical protein